MRTSTLFSSAAAPVLLIGGWLLAESRQPPAFDPFRDAISDLAAIGATDRAIMTAALAGTGLAHLITAFGLTDAGRAARALIALGGVATILVAVFPLPEQGSSPAHTTVATTAFLALAIWPFVSGGVRRPISLAAGAVLLGLVAWFGVTLQTGGPLGLAERTAAAAQAFWPFAVALSIHLRWGRVTGGK